MVGWLVSDVEFSTDAWVAGRVGEQGTNGSLEEEGCGLSMVGWLVASEGLSGEAWLVGSIRGSGGAGACQHHCSLAEIHGCPS